MKTHLKHIEFSKKYYTLLLGILTLTIGHTQVINKGDFYISKDALLSVNTTFNNDTTGEFYNDGRVYFFRNTTNNGLLGYFEGGTTYFQGTQHQVIDGNVSYKLFDVWFQNSNWQDAFRLIGELEIDANANFSYGILNNRDYGGKIIFTQNANHTQASQYSHVDGYVEKTGTVDFTFPIGHKTHYRRMDTNSDTMISGHMEGVYFFENSNQIYPHSERESHIEIINDSEYWICNNLAEDSSVFLTLHLDENTTPFEIRAGLYDESLRIVNWDSNMQQWIDKGGATNPGQNSITTIIDSFGTYTLARTKTVPNGDLLDIYNAISPGEDGKNDFFRIEGIEKYPNNHVMIFNRWGIMVFDKQGYDNVEVAFRGYSDGRATINKNEQLPSGTYFYIIEFSGDSYPTHKNYSGYLYIN